jgi:hypothetical protein
MLFIVKAFVDQFTVFEVLKNNLEKYVGHGLSKHISVQNM